MPHVDPCCSSRQQQENSNRREHVLFQYDPCHSPLRMGTSSNGGGGAGRGWLSSLKLRLAGWAAAGEPSAEETAAAALSRDVAPGAGGTVVKAAVSSEQKAKLLAIANEAGVPMAAVLRTMIDLWPSGDSPAYPCGSHDGAVPDHKRPEAESAAGETADDAEGDAEHGPAQLSFRDMGF